MPTLTRPERAALLDSLQHFVPLAQMAGIKQMMAERGYEGDLDQPLLDLAATIKAMPKTYEQDGKGMEAIAHLHYFGSACDWYVSERDMGGDQDKTPGEQHQAFGLACLGFMEQGYISLWELFRHPSIEVDLHWTPKTLRECMAECAKNRGEA